MVGQLYGFMAEFGYLLGSALIRFIGRDYYGAGIIDLVNSLRILEFGVLSCVQVLNQSRQPKYYDTVQQ